MSKLNNTGENKIQRRMYKKWFFARDGREKDSDKWNLNIKCKWF